MAGWWSSQDTRHLHIKFATYFGYGSWHPQKSQWHHQRSLIIGHRNKYNNNVKVWKNCQNVTKTWSKPMLLESGDTDFLDTEWPHTFNSHKTQCSGSTVRWVTTKQSTTEWSIPVCEAAQHSPFQPCPCELGTSHLQGPPFSFPVQQVPLALGLLSVISLA